MRVTTGPLTGHCRLKGHVVKFGLVDSPKCNRCIQTSEKFSVVLDDCKALTVLSFSHLAHHFLKSGGFAAVCLCEGCTEDGKRSRCEFAAVPALMYSRFSENVWIL